MILFYECGRLGFSPLSRNFLKKSKAYSPVYPRLTWLPLICTTWWQVCYTGASFLKRIDGIVFYILKESSGIWSVGISLRASWLVKWMWREFGKVPAVLRNVTSSKYTVVSGLVIRACESSQPYIQASTSLPIYIAGAGAQEKLLPFRQLCWTGAASCPPRTWFFPFFRRFTWWFHF